MAGYTKPLPTPDRDTKGFWEGCRAHELRMQRCRDCGQYCFPPLSMCPYCNSQAREWAKVSGRGKLYSWLIVNYATHPDFVDDVPYPLVLVTLAEQDDLHIPGNIINCALEDLRLDLPVEVVFDDVTDEVTLPRWQPTGAGPGQTEASPH